MPIVSCSPAQWDELLWERRRRGADLYDHEIGDRYVMAPAPGARHADTQAALLAALRAVPGGLRAVGPTNVGRVDGAPGERWFVVPDVVVLPGDADLTGSAQRHVEVAIEIRSPGEDVAAKLADYRAVMAQTGARIGEAWVVDGSSVTVWIGADEAGPTRHPQLLAACHDALGE